MADVTERALWNRYMAVYQDIVRHTSTAIAPWYVVPADHKWFARVVIGSAIVSTLETLNLRFPRADKASLQEFKRVREALLQEGKGRAVKKAAAGKVAKK
jgi:Polyphosphate kinase 2 (PPK2)